MRYIGAHVSIAGGLEQAPKRADEIGANAFALFTKNQRRWNSPPLNPKTIQAFKNHMNKFGFKKEHIVPHGSYLINLAHPNEENRIKSLTSFIDEIKRTNQLDLKYLNIHPGSGLNQINLKESVSRAGKSVKEALGETEQTILLIETTAGQGGNIGFNFSQIRDILDITGVDRVGVCVDTCHIFAAGYNIRNEYEYEKTWIEFSEKIGFKNLKALHLNDSKKKSGNRVDRHASLGDGEIGWNTFKRMAQDKRFQDLPAILETPEKYLWAREIETLYSFSST